MIAETNTLLSVLLILTALVVGLALGYVLRHRVGAVRVDQRAGVPGGTRTPDRPSTGHTGGNDGRSGPESLT